MPASDAGGHFRVWASAGIGAAAIGLGNHFWCPKRAMARKWPATRLGKHGHLLVINRAAGN